MKEYVRARTVRKGDMLLPSSILFHDRLYPVSEVIRHCFYQGETVFTVRIGNRITNIYRDERCNRWFVNSKTSAPQQAVPYE
ncbi:MAG: hypothetical protein IJ242_13865 [Clostridia bacterium]|nr:hypothetical protein [Clostridia bacterium]